MLEVPVVGSGQCQWSEGNFRASLSKRSLVRYLCARAHAFRAASWRLYSAQILRAFGSRIYAS